MKLTIMVQFIEKKDETDETFIESGIPSIF